MLLSGRASMEGTEREGRRRKERSKVRVRDGEERRRGAMKRRTGSEMVGW